MVRKNKKAVSQMVIMLILAAFMMLLILGLLLKFVPPSQKIIYQLFGINKVNDYKEKIEEQLGYDRAKAAETYKEFKEKYPDEILPLREDVYLDLVKAVEEKSKQDATYSNTYDEAFEEFKKTYPQSEYVKQIEANRALNIAHPEVPMGTTPGMPR